MSDSSPDNQSDLPWEDNLLERKTASDLGDLPKTLVAFANSVRPGHTAVILIGEKDDETPQGLTDPDATQKKLRHDADKIYPPILWKSFVYEKQGKCCIRVEIEYDGDTPHFGDAAWIRRGSITEKASDQMFQRLIEYRLSKVRLLAEWIGKNVTVAPDVPLPLEMDMNKQFQKWIYHPRWPVAETHPLARSTSFGRRSRAKTAPKCQNPSKKSF